MFGFSFTEEFQGIPTRDEWVRYTSSSRVHHRGPELVAIDVALDHYHQSMASPSYGYGGLKAAITKMKIVTMQLSSILQVCQAWISAKSKAWELGLSSRAPLVRRLITNALEALEVLDPQKKGYDRKDPTVYFRHVASDYRWRMLLPLIHNFSKDTPGKQLAPLTILEANPAVNPEHFYGSTVAHQFRDQAQATAEESEVTTAFNFVFDFIRQAKMDAARVLYLPQDHRWPHQIVFYNGLAWRVDQRGRPISLVETPASGHGELLISGTTKIMYYLEETVMQSQKTESDRQRLNPAAFKAKAGGPPRLIPRADEHKPAQHQHSSFLAGEPCFFAGGAIFDEGEPGRLIAIDNCSGHYQPKPKEIAKALKFMKEEDAGFGPGLDLEKIEIKVGLNVNGPQGWDFGPAALGINAAQAMDDHVFQYAIKKAQTEIYEKTIANYGGNVNEVEWTTTTLQEAKTLGIVPLDFLNDPEQPITRPQFKIRTDINFY
jgi:hypothetical protein